MSAQSTGAGAPGQTRTLDLSDPESYRLFLKVKSLPVYRVQGRTVWVPDEYAHLIDGARHAAPECGYEPAPYLFDYQRDIAALAIRKRKFAVFAQPGLGKTGILLEFARHALAALRGRRVLVVSPPMVIAQTVAEAERFYGGSLPLERVPAAGLQAWLDRRGPAVGVTNYEAVREGLTPGRLGALILDECFPKGTPVGTVDSNGLLEQKPIETLRPGARIISAAGIDVVADIHRREVQYAIRIKCGGKAFIASPNHPLFTRRGWIGAQDLEPGDCLLEAESAVRMVRRPVHPQDALGGIEEVLQSILLSEMADDATGGAGEGSHRGGSREDRAEEGSLVCGGHARGGKGAGANSQPEPHDESGSAGESEPRLETHEAQTFRAWGEWSGGDQTGEDADGCTWSVLGAVCRVVGPANSRLSVALQDRLRQSRLESRHRGGWSIPSRAEESRPEERRQTGFIGVDSIEVLEPGHPDLDRLRNADGKLYFYDLGATRHPSYSVEGFLVHNSSMLKSHYGAWGRRLIALGRGLGWKLCLTGTPAPNDRIEYANHAVFLDHFPTVNSFLARFFVNRGQTDNRWELKPHALRPFYRSLSHWCVFLESPATYGWKDNAGGFPPIITHIHDVPLTEEQVSLSGRAGGDMFGAPGGIGSRSKVGRLAKGWFQNKKVASRKPAFLRALVDSWPGESTIVWCKYNAEQDGLAALLPEAGSIAGDTPQERRDRIVADFQAGRTKALITKPKILGLGLNLQVATRQVFSTIEDSYESFFQAVKRSNRVGSTRPLNVHIPITELERPMVETVLAKAARVQADSEEQERLFKEVGCGAL